MIPGYAHPETLGHRMIEGLFLGTVRVAEKVDGSQFSFQRLDGQIHFRSRKQEVHPASAGMFSAGCEAVLQRADILTEGWVYRGEFLAKPKHNILAYGRVPLGHIILFDVETDEGQHYLGAEGLAEEADRLGMEAVPVFHDGPVGSVDGLKTYLERESVLGGQQVEGIVVKNYDRFGVDSRPLMGKLVRSDFKEAHRIEWKAANPGPADIVEALIIAYRTEARWQKAVQHLAEQGLLANAPQDIGPLLAEVGKDVEGEEATAIKDALYSWAWPKIRRGLAAGFPAWYKDKLASGQPH